MRRPLPLLGAALLVVAGVAPVTIDDDEWIYAAVYADALIRT